MKYQDISENWEQDDEERSLEAQMREEYLDSIMIVNDAATYGYAYDWKGNTDWAGATVDSPNFDINKAEAELLPIIKKFQDEYPDVSSDQYHHWKRTGAGPEPSGFLKLHIESNQWKELHNMMEQLIESDKVSTEEFVELFKKYMKFLEKFVTTFDEWVEENQAEQRDMHQDGKELARDPHGYYGVNPKDFA